MNKKVLIIAITIILIGFAIFYFVNKQNNPITDNSIVTNFKEEIFTIEVIAKEGETVRYPFASLNDETLEQTLDIAVEDNQFAYTKQVSDFGSFVTSINEISADPTKEFWSIKINGEDSLVGISQINPNENDLIQFILTQFN